MENNEHIARLRWSCRRGMLELDLLLAPFLENKFSNLNTQEKTQFECLLACTDQELYQWLVKRETPEALELAPIIARILDREPS